MITTLSCYLDLDDETAIRLQRLLVRDTRVINRVISVLRQEEKNIFKKKKSGKWYASRKVLADLMMTTSNRAWVKYDLKSEFPRISHNEMMECIDTARENYLAYMTNRENMNASPPTADYRDGYVPRSVGYRRFRLQIIDAEFDEDSAANKKNNDKYEERKTKKITLSVIDSYDTNLEFVKRSRDGDSDKLSKKVRHDYLELNVVSGDNQYDMLSQFADNVKSLKLLCDQNLRKNDPYRYRVQFAIEVDVEQKKLDNRKEIAVVGMDMGIKKMVTAVVLTKSGVVEAKTFRRQSKKRIEQIDERLREIKQEVKKREFDYYQGRINYFIQLGKSGELNWKVLQLLQQMRAELRKSQMKYFGLDETQHTWRKMWFETQSNNINILESGAVGETKRILKKIRKVIERLVRNWDQLGKTDGLYAKIKWLNTRRKNLIDDQIKQSCATITSWLNKLNETYNIYMAMGDVSWIRKNQRRGNGRKWLRKAVHEWNYKRIYEQLQHDLAKIGLNHRFFLVGEYWTSQLCHRCEKKGMRPKQWKFCCSNYSCGWQGNADVNGAINIAKRLIRWKKLVKKKELNVWRIQI